MVYVESTSCSFFPMALPASAGNTNVQYFLNLLMGALVPIPGQSLNYCFTTLQPFPSWQLSTDPSVVGETSDYGSLNADSIASVVAAWQLLGVITGIPPYPADAAGVKLTVATSQSSSSTVTVTSAATVNVNGTANVGPVVLGGTIANAVASGSGSTSTISLSMSYVFSKGVDPANLGFFIVWQPTYERISYGVRTWDLQQEVSFRLTLLWCIDGQNLGLFPFDMTDPDQVVDPSDPALPLLCRFPTTSDGETVSWHDSTDLSWWHSQYSPASLVDAWHLQPLCELGQINATKFATFLETLSITGAANITSTYTNTITITANVKVPLFSLGTNATLSSQTTVTTNVQSGLAITVEYDQLEPQGPGDYSKVDITPYLFLATAGGAPWVPTIYGLQRPWLLTWQVTELEVESTAPEEDAPTT